MSKDNELLRAIGERENPPLGAKDGEGKYLYRCVLGLDLPESEWTVEHDANFARVVLPWLRANRDSHWRFFEELRITAPATRNPYHVVEGVFLEHPHPGPLMCRAIYAVLCGKEIG